MITTDKLLKYLKKNDAENGLLINSNQYSLTQVRLAEKIVKDLEKELLLASVKPKLSRRRAFIVILEELYYDTSKYPDELSLDNIHRRASMRFEYMNRETRGFETPTQVHPKNPCLYYEENAHGKARYRTALEHLVYESNKYFQLPEAETTLEVLFNDVKLC